MTHRCTNCNRPFILLAATQKGDLCPACYKALKEPKGRDVPLPPKKGRKS